MSAPVELEFHIGAYTPETIPMERLAEYLSDLATILGEPTSVHLARVEGGSVMPVVHVDYEAAPKVTKRVRLVRSNEGPEEAMRAKRRIEKRLAADNAPNAELRERGPEGARILLFRGKGLEQESYGPVRQAGEIIGTVIMVGGKNDPVPVHIEDGKRVYLCEARRDMARQLAVHLFDAPIRVSGFGKWFRNDDGEWEMIDFRINAVEKLKAAPVGAIIQQLREVKSSWLSSDDPLAKLDSD